MLKLASRITVGGTNKFILRLRITSLGQHRMSIKKEKILEDMSKLVIVESPAKAKTIKKYLGKDYKILASVGHVRDLPAKGLSVNTRKNFEPKYEIIEGKEKVIEELKKNSENSEKVYLATDPDREGEAISWHLAYILGLDSNKKNRVTFNEITKNGVTNGMKHPRKIDMDLVNAQQARRILDRLVGYKLSPFVSRKIRGGLSAGRVQSVAVRIIVDREKEIKDFVPEEYWTLDALFNLPKKKILEASFYGKDNKKMPLENKETVDGIISDLSDAVYKIKSTRKSKRKKLPSPPFTTSTMQQEASKNLGFTSKRTMQIAQSLYEGIEIKDVGLTGLITYMRTDSLRISDDAINSARDYIGTTFGKDYLPEKPRHYKSKASAQDGHEAIRPTNINFDPETIKTSLKPEQYRLYKLIWQRFLKSQMADCIHDTVSASIEAKDYIFKASGYTVSFKGFTILSPEVKEEKIKNEVLFTLKNGDILNLKELLPAQHFTEPPARYTEASLIKALEENGIGRPSTYAATISTILAREYVGKDGKNLFPTELGTVVVDLMKKHFKNIVDVKFTAQMESNLDLVEEGKEEWTALLKNFYDDFKVTLKKATEDTKDVKISLASDKTDIKCEKCGKPMVVKSNRYGKFLGCSGYPDCKNIKRMIIEDGEIKPETNEISDTPCPNCGKNMIVKFGRYGKFLACPDYPDCKGTGKIKENIPGKCPKCGKDLVRRLSKRKRYFYGCSAYPKCGFISWDEPLEENCPNCNKTLFKKKGKKSVIYCQNEECGYRKEEKAG